MPDARTTVEDSLIGPELTTAGSSKKIGSGRVGYLIGVVFQPKKGFRLSAMLVFLMLAGLSSNAQIATAPTSPPQQSIPASPLNGNWYIAGNRMKKQFPVLSTYLQVNGTQVIGHGYVQAVCPNDPRNGGGVT